MHIHIGVLHALGIFASVVIVGFFWRTVAGLNAQNKLGQAMSYIY